MSINKIGLAGCGRMGLPMVKALARFGSEHGKIVKGFDIRPTSEFGDFPAI